MTPKGRRLLAAAAALYVAGTWLGYRELNVLGAAGVLLVVVAIGTVARPVTLDADRRVSPDRVRVGDRAEGALTITNRGTRRSPTLLGVELVAPEDPGADAKRPGDPVAAGPGGGVELAVDRLGPARTQALTFPLPTARRAVLRVGPFVVTRADPFGIVERRSTHGRPARFWVHPRVHPIGPLPLGRQRDLEGPTNESARGESVFHSLREYVVGDDLRRVHWKATAHHGTLMVREHADPIRPDATVVLDDRTAAAIDDDGFDLAVEAVASVAVVARRAGFPVQLLSTSGQVRTSALADDTVLLDLLAGITRQSRDETAGVTRQLITGPGGRALVVVTGRPSADDLTRWAGAGRRFGLIVVIAVLPPRPGIHPSPTSLTSPSDPTTAGHDEAGLPAAPAGVRLVPIRSADDLVAGWGGLR